MELYIRQLTSKLKKHLILTIFFVLYFMAFWFLFFTKGIYVDGHFYKKSANLTTITYTCKNSAAEFEKIVLQKQLDYSIITLDDDYVLTVNSAGGVSIDGNMGPDSTLPDARWDLIADQSAERNRGFGSKPWILVLVVFVVMFIVKRYSTQVYTLFRKNRAAGESYYKAVDIIFKVVCIAGLVYLIIPV